MDGTGGTVGAHDIGRSEGFGKDLPGHLVIGRPLHLLRGDEETFRTSPAFPDQELPGIFFPYLLQLLCNRIEGLFPCDLHPARVHIGPLFRIRPFEGTFHPVRVIQSHDRRDGANADLSKVGGTIGVPHDIGDNAVFEVDERAVIGLHTHHAETGDPPILRLPGGFLGQLCQWSDLLLDIHRLR